MGGSDKNLIGIGDALEAGSQGAIILTVNRRLSLEIRAQYNREQLVQGRQVWESVNAISWSDWMQGLFQDLVDLGLSDLMLLTQHQTNMLWEQIIRHTDKGNLILSPAGSAKIANKAWMLVQSWAVPVEQLSAAATSETERFLSWIDEFRGICQRKKWIDQALVSDLVSQSFSKSDLKHPAEIILAGFDEITPQQQGILDLLHDKGCKINYLAPADTSGSVRRFQAVDITQELKTAAGWAIDRLRQRSEARIGIVVPQLDKLRIRVETVFKRCLSPKSILPDIDDVQQAYNISLGMPLNQCPLVVDAFLILHFASGELSCGDISRLLRSPFIFGSLQERARRARLDAYIRNRIGERTVSLNTLIRQTGSFNQDDNACPVLLISLQNFRRRQDQLPPRQSPQQWTEEFQTLLHAIGWGRHENMNSDEYQQLERFNETMTVFQMLGQVQHTMDLHEAIDRLYSIAQETQFQTQGSAAPIQIVGTLEASGLRFDNLWVVGMSDDCWPPAASPNPLLPISIQRKLGLPHASPQRELEYASAITQRLLSGAGEVVVSHAETDGVNRLRVSPLVAHLPLVTADDLDIAQVVDISRIGFGSTELEELVDQDAPPLPAGAHLPGGTRLLADQSACPFRAFANHRLGASAIEDPVSGMDARTRGIMTHRVLQGVWRQIGDQERLLTMEHAELRQLVTEVVSQVLSGIRLRRPETAAPRFIEIEQERVTELTMEWLGLERLRAPFKVVSLEQRQVVAIGGLLLDVVTDRIDELEDKRQLIVDYKTTKKKDLTKLFKKWFEMRIGEPQLPLYAITNEADIAGVLLAGVNMTSMGFIGVCEESDLVPGIKAFNKDKSNDHIGWDELKKEWRQQLELLAHEVLEGWAEVNPQDYKNDCKFCPLPSLCRIHEQLNLDTEEDEA